MAYLINKIINRLKRLLNTKNSELILSQINANSNGNQDYTSVGLLALFMVSRDLIKNSINALNKNNYYAANILVRKVFENALVFIRIYDENKLAEYFQLCKDLKQDKVSIFDKDVLKYKKCIFRDLSNIEESRKHFASINQAITKEDLDLSYKTMCEYTHLNLTKIGQYKHHLHKLDIKKINIWSYDYDFHRETVVSIMLSFENLIFAIEHVCKSKQDYDKKVFDRIYHNIDKNRTEYKEGTSK